jgi:hypothetical protein
MIEDREDINGITKFPKLTEFGGKEKEGKLRCTPYMYRDFQFRLETNNSIQIPLIWEIW